jgi:uncharacterized protein (TIGR03083 family)
MDTVAVLKYGHQAVLDAVADVADSDWEKPGACGDWSIKDILAHLTSFEQMLVDVVMETLLGCYVDTPTLKRFIEDDDHFNDAEVEDRRLHTAAAILEEYQSAHEQVMKLFVRLPADVILRKGLLSWYGSDYDLEDFIVYTFYGHKREHCAQIAAFRDQLARQAIPVIHSN